MRIFPRDLLQQNLEGMLLRENFMVAAVSTIMVIRIFLSLTGYPTVGGSYFHIAHLLWGGLLMLLGIVILLSFLSRSATHAAAIIAGIGFGAFIDELGKFITRDNNYFFQPTFALIYVIFILLYLASLLLRRRTITKQEYLINALEMTKEAVTYEMDDEEKEQALSYLKKADQKHPLVQSLQSYLQQTQPLPTPRQSLLVRARHQVADFYLQLVRSNLLSRFLGIILLGQVIFTSVVTLVLADSWWNLNYVQYGKLFSDGLALLFILSGFAAFAFKAQRRGYRFFKLSILTTLLLTQFFQFISGALWALFGIIFNVLLLLVVDYILEKLRAQNGSTGTAR